LATTIWHIDAVRGPSTPSVDGHLIAATFETQHHLQRDQQIFDAASSRSRVQALVHDLPSVKVLTVFGQALDKIAYVAERGQPG
jgi:hypothetical protein